MVRSVCMQILVYAEASTVRTERVFCRHRAHKVKRVAYWTCIATIRPVPNPGTRDDANGLRRPPESSCTKARREMREKVGERVRENQAPASLPLLLWLIIHWVTVRPSADQPWAAAPFMCIVYTGCRESTDLLHMQRIDIADNPSKSRLFYTCIARHAQHG